VYLPGLGRAYGRPLDAIGRVVPLPDDEAHHLLRVLRRRAGDEIVVFDGRGSEWAARVATAGRNGATIEIGGERLPAAEPAVAVTLAVGVLKGDQMDTVVRDATALGVRRIVPLASAHVTVPERAWRGDAARARWTRVAVAAARQSGRAVVPQFAPVASFDVCLERPAGAGLYIAVEPARAVDAPGPEGAPPAAAVVLVGPEGGWSADEIERALAAGAGTVNLGPRTLRAELVPAVLLSALWTRWGWR
jgi:16S rRNA (uracil1498-N3)-methyltransferase